VKTFFVDTPFTSETASPITYNNLSNFLRGKLPIKPVIFGQILFAPPPQHFFSSYGYTRQRAHCTATWRRFEIRFLRPRLNSRPPAHEARALTACPSRRLFQKRENFNFGIELCHLKTI